MSWDRRFEGYTNHIRGWENMDNIRCRWKWNLGLRRSQGVYLENSFCLNEPIRRRGSRNLRNNWPRRKWNRWQEGNGLIPESSSGAARELTRSWWAEEKIKRKEKAQKAHKVLFLIDELKNNHLYLSILKR